MEVIERAARQVVQMPEIALNPKLGIFMSSDRDFRHRLIHFLTHAIRAMHRNAEQNGTNCSAFKHPDLSFHTLDAERIGFEMPRILSIGRCPNSRKTNRLAGTVCAPKGRSVQSPLGMKPC